LLRAVVRCRALDANLAEQRKPPRTAALRDVTNFIMPAAWK